jgi:hypothetical protein
MQLTIARAYELLLSHGVFTRDCCDKCGRLLGAVRFTDRRGWRVVQPGMPRGYRTRCDPKGRPSKEVSEPRRTACGEDPPAEGLSERRCVEKTLL